MTDPETPDQPPVQPMSQADLEALRARQKSRNRAMAIVLWALVILFFVISIVKLKIKGQL